MTDLRGTPVDSPPLPEAVDFVVAGSGSAGAAIAGLLTELTDASVCLLEAGPDYGPRDSGHWPEDLLDAATLAIASHDWGYTGLVKGRTVEFHRAKVMGGCSSHNGGVAIVGHRLDYDRWAAAGNEGWTTAELQPLFDGVFERLQVRDIPLEAMTPFQGACAYAMDRNGIPIVEDLNNWDEVNGVAPFSVSIDTQGRRFSSPFAYLDPVRDKGNLTIVGDALAERVVLEGGRVTGVVVRHGGEEVTVKAPIVIVAGGAYGSPQLLLRSGIGPADHLREVGVEVSHDLPGVGENLHDQPTIEVDFTGTDELRDEMVHFAKDHWRPDEQVIAKYPSSYCDEGFDLHTFPIGGRDPFNRDGWRWTLGAALLTPESRGYLRLTGPDSSDPADIDHRFLTDSEGSDLRRLVECVERTREIAADPELAPLLGDEIFPGPAVKTHEELTALVADSSVHYWHPVGSCKMGPASDDKAVVDNLGRVHGVDGLHVADASIMPAMMSGNTNVPTVVIAEKLARRLAAEA